MLVRFAVANDLEQVSGLFDQYRTFYGQTPDLALAREFVGERMQRSESVILVAQAANSELAGFTQLFPGFSSVSAARTFILNDLFVSPGYRRQGVARMLLKAAQAFAFKAKALHLSLSTEITNHPAQALYQSLGWVKDQEFQYFSLAVGANTAPEPASLPGAARLTR